jgi:myosin protein heavy chain
LFSWLNASSLVAKKICHLLGLNGDEFVKAVLRPKVKVQEYVERSQNAEQAKFSVEAISKATYERLFKWLVARLNKTMDRSAADDSGTTFIGILDISGYRRSVS